MSDHRLAVVPPGAENASDDPEAGRIVRVRVFIDRASITRRREWPQMPANKEVELAIIPLDVDPTTIRAEAFRVGAKDPVPVRVSGVTATLAYAQPSNERFAAVKKEIEDVESKLAALDDVDATERHAAMLLGQYAAIATSNLSLEWLDASPDVGKWSEVFDHLRRSRAKLAAAESTRVQERRRLHQRQSELFAEEARLGRPERLGYRVRVALGEAADGPGRLAVELTYITQKARWMPSYDARWLAADAEHPERIALTAIALVQQTTGEDWKDVELIATTARPPLAEPPPSLAKLVVTGFQGGVDKEIVSVSREEKRLTGAGGESRGPAATVEHLAPGRVSIPSTNRPVRVELFEGQLVGRARLECVPALRAAAISVAEVENRTGRVLLPGRVNVFRGANYSGQTQLGFVTAGERFRIPLGTDASLRVRRESHAEPEKRGAITGAVSHTVTVKTKLENVSKHPVEVVVHDRVPVSRAEDVTVRILETDKAAEIQAETGLTSLRLTLPPLGERTISASFRITAPRGFRILPPGE